MRLGLCAVLALWVGVATACEPKATGGSLAVGQTTPVPIVTQFAGSDSGFATAQALIIQSREQLEGLGSEDAVNLDVDFDANSLVLLTIGEMPTDGYGVTIHAIQRHGDRLYVQASFEQPGADMAAQVLTYPYAAAVIGKTQATKVQVESAP